MEKHHVFPKSQLYDNGYNPKNSIDKRYVNEIANMAFITEKSNKDIFTKLPEDYLPTIDAIELSTQFVPLDKNLWKLENYKEFLSERRRLLSEGLNAFLTSFHKVNDTTTNPKYIETLNQRIEQIELSMRDKISEILEAKALENALEEFLPSHLQGNVNDRIKKWLKDNPGEPRDQFSTLRRVLDFFDLQEYNDIISNKDNWRIFEDYFDTKEKLQQRFNQLAGLRNTIRHSRDLTEATIKDGEAAIAWFGSILRSVGYVDNDVV